MLQELVAEHKEYFSYVKIKEAPEIAADGSAVNVLVDELPEDEEAMIHVGSHRQLPSQLEVGDLYLACFINGNRSNGVLIAFLNNDDKRMHSKASEGHTVVSSLSNKLIYLSNDDTKTLDQWAVLGPLLVEWLIKQSNEIVKIGQKLDDLKSDLNSLITSYNGHVHSVTSLGSPTTPTTSLGSNSSVTTQSERNKIDELTASGETDKFLSDLVVIQEREA